LSGPEERLSQASKKALDATVVLLQSVPEVYENDWNSNGAPPQQREEWQDYLAP
jgi:hypothetical protein